MSLRFKTFTQSYMLIKNNSHYGKSLGDRGQAAVMFGCLLAVFVTAQTKLKLPANDRI